MKNKRQRRGRSEKSPLAFFWSFFFDSFFDLKCANDSEQKLRLWFKQQQVRLYWIFLRTAGSPGIFDQPEDSRDDNAGAMPELYLHKFFLGLGSPYQAYEAESPDALKQAIADINRLENLPMHYFERIPKQDLSAACYSVAALLLLVLLGVKFCEVKR